MTNPNNKLMEDIIAVLEDKESATWDAHFAVGLSAHYAQKVSEDINAILTRIESALNNQSVDSDAGDDEYMCPNCVTPWKCNGPHTPDKNTNIDVSYFELVNEYPHSKEAVSKLQHADKNGGHCTLSLMNVRDLLQALQTQPEKDRVMEIMADALRYNNTALRSALSDLQTLYSIETKLSKRIENDVKQQQIKVFIRMNNEALAEYAKIKDGK